MIKENTALFSVKMRLDGWPALLFYQILTTLYKEKNLPSPETRFFAGQRFTDQAQKEKVVKEFKNFIEMSSEMGGVKESAKNKKVLVVTDTLRTGEHIRHFMGVLKKLKINFDIATISFVAKSEEITEKRRKDLENTLGGKIFWGREYGPAFHRTIGGVKKSDKPAPFAELLPPPETSKGIKNYYSQKRAAARLDIENLAEKLAKWYKEKNIGVNK